MHLSESPAPMGLPEFVTVTIASRLRDNSRSRIATLGVLAHRREVDTIEEPVELLDTQLDNVAIAWPEKTVSL
jgi:hypothetical protein